MSRDQRNLWAPHRPAPDDDTEATLGDPEGPEPDPFDAYDQAEAEEFASGHYPRPGAGHCDECGYRLDAPGHLAQLREPPVSYVRRDLLERHSRRTGMTVSHAPLEDSQKRVLEDAALTVCDRYGRADAAELLAMLGLVHPDGPANVGVRVVAGSKPVPHAHMRRGRAK